MTDPTAVLGRRTGAFFIDVATALLAFTLIFIPLATQRSVEETLDLPGCTLDQDTEQITCDNRQVVRIGDTVYEAGGATFLVDLAFVVLYFGLIAGLTGATLGKALVGIRVVKEDGSLVGIPRSLLRGLLWFVDIFVVGLVLMLTQRGHRRLGDMAAGTYVVSKNAVGSPIVLPQQPGAYPYQPAPQQAQQAQWDPARNAYVQWDPASGRYLTWDESAQTWR